MKTVRAWLRHQFERFRQWLGEVLPQPLVEWINGLILWLVLCRPSKQGEYLEYAREVGRREGAERGVEQVYLKLAQMNREQRRKFVRQIVKEYKPENLTPR